MLTAYKEYILTRWEEGCQNALQLWREVKVQGFSGGAVAVNDFVRPLRQPGMTPGMTPSGFPRLERCPDI